MKTALIACGSLAREVLSIKEKNGWKADLFCLPALLHNHPDRIAPAVLSQIRQLRPTYDNIIVVYGDCGTGGELDRVLEAEGVQRVAGPHCYQLYAREIFESLMNEEPGTFFLTDYLVNSFDHLVVEELGLDRFPQLRDDYFKNYKRVIYLSQRDDLFLQEKARRAAEFLKLPLQVMHTGYGALESELVRLVAE